MQIKTSLAIAIVAVSVASLSLAENLPLTLSTVKRDPVASKAFEAMKKDHALPSWVERGGTETRGNSVSFDGRQMVVMTACKPHDCGSERFAILYDPQRNVMYGLLLVVDPKRRDTERLTWMNLRDGGESIDGRAILYAALTGSVANHPDAFNFK
ncbi:Ivy family c-type lysozyme inhibitor [Burkholderia pseudomultivorans]|uniref:Inhibitor of vertebrate lysozyme n=1 Tax=Burkholderia cenocepacia TaxID=95486 RepID=A0AAN0RM16_9BURK|nr:Ivy family c-type lysozyme inhibitor [Burkholderia pseudomultivorans]AIO30130.1 inhibitor of vertebrate lysozyme [Burkholderia cenocepacia]KWI47814.1 C-lysozyme inhibitor [Burkholderia pseudomultivorans]MBF5010624.1 C-lysozyme inhibitor [Burkholderia pseudomultivorans]